MAVETVKAGVQSAEDVIAAAVARSKEVMQRHWTVYDHEKVFWNSTWTVGIIGLAWVSVKFGLWLDSIWGFLGQTGTTARGLEPLVSVLFYTDQPAFGLQKQFFETVDWVEGEHKDEALPEFRSGPGGVVWNAIERYRSNPAEYAAFKTTMFKKWSEAYPATSGRPSLEEQYKTYLQGQTDVDVGVSGAQNMRALSGKTVLEELDKFFSAYGAVLPFAAVAGHMGLESLRVYRLRKQLGKEG